MIVIPKRNWRYPLSYERTYSKELTAIVNNLNSATNLYKNEIDNYISQNRFDDDNLDGLVDRIKNSYFAKVTKDFLQRKIEQMFDIVNKFNMNEFTQSIKQVLGVDIFKSEPKLNELKDLWVKENVNLIKSVEDEYFNRIENIISDAVRDGTLTDDVVEQIQKLTGVSKKRAQLIAVDQIGKLNGQITKYRQTSAGIKEYIWRTAGDSRVRPLHQLRNRKRFSWDKPPLDGHPGMAIRCRCVAIPVIDTENLGVVTPTPAQDISPPKAKVKTVLEQAMGEIHTNNVKDILKNCNNTFAKKFWNKYENLIDVDTVSKRNGGTYAIGNKITLNIDEVSKGNYYETKYETLFHEGAHAIDYALTPNKRGYYSVEYKNGAFLKALKDDVKSFVQKRNAVLKAEFKKRAKANDFAWFKDNGFGFYNKPPKFTIRYTYDLIEKEIEKIDSIKRANLSDILEGATNSRLQCGFGHGKSYWKEEKIDGISVNVAIEAFAEMLASSIANEDSWEVLADYLPNATKIFKEMLEELSNGH